MRTVWKFPIGTTIDLPLLDTKIVMVEARADSETGQVEGHVWIELDPGVAREKRVRFSVIGTGKSIPEGRIHIGSLRDGPFVWHIYMEYVDTENG